MSWPGHHCGINGSVHSGRTAFLQWIFLSWVLTNALPPSPAVSEHKTSSTWLQNIMKSLGSKGEVSINWILRYSLLNYAFTQRARKNTSSTAELQPTRNETWRLAGYFIIHVCKRHVELELCASPRPADHLNLRSYLTILTIHNWIDM